MVERYQVSERVDRHTVAVEYLISVIADVESFSSVVADYVVFYNDFLQKYGISKENKENIKLEDKQIEEEDLIKLREKAYNVRAYLVKLYGKIKSLATFMNYTDIRDLDDKYKKIVDNIIIDDNTVNTFPPGQLKQLIKNAGQIPFSVVVDGIPVKVILQIE